MKTRIESSYAIVAPMRQYTKMVIDGELLGFTLTGIDLGSGRDVLTLARDCEDGVPYNIYITDACLMPGVERSPLDGPLDEITTGVQALAEAIRQAVPGLVIDAEGSLVMGGTLSDTADPVY